MPRTPKKFKILRYLGTLRPQSIRITYLFRPIRIRSWTINFSNSLPWILAMGVWTGAPLFSVFTEAAEGEAAELEGVGEAKPAWLLESLRASKAHASLSCGLPMLVAAMASNSIRSMITDYRGCFSHMPFFTPKTFETLAKNAVRDSRSELFLSMAGTDSVKRQTRPSQAKKKVSFKLYYYCRNSKFSKEAEAAA